MNTYRPTTLKLASRNCPQAVSFYEEDRQSFRDHFAQGISAHAVLEQLGVLTVDKGSTLTEEESRLVADKVCERLISEGRTFDGRTEPPLAADAVFAGRELALRWVALSPLSTTAKYEFGMGFDADWNLSGYSSDKTRFRLILDVFDDATDEDEENGTAIGLRVCDYKSAWSTDETELDTLQLHGQVLAAWHASSALGKTPEFIRQEVVNLRTHQSVARTIWLNEPGMALLGQWQRDIEIQMRALDKTREARPGLGCMSCAWASGCGDRRTFVAGVLGNAELSSREDVAKAYVATMGLSSTLQQMTRAACDDAPIDIGDAIVGTMGEDINEPLKEAMKLAWTAWEQKGGDWSSFLDRFKPGVKGLESIAVALRPRKPMDQQELLGQWTKYGVRRTFGIHKKNQRKTEVKE